MSRQFVLVAFAALLALATQMTQPVTPVNAQGQPCPVYYSSAYLCFEQNSPVGQVYLVRLVLRNDSPSPLGYHVRITHDGQATETSAPSLVALSSTVSDLGYLADCTDQVTTYCTWWTVKLNPGESALFSLPVRTHAVTYVRTTMLPEFTLADGGVRHYNPGIVDMPVYYGDRSYERANSPAVIFYPVP